MGKKATPQEAKIVLNDAIELMHIIAHFINEKPHRSEHGMTILAYAVELIIHSASNGDMKEFDRLSKTWKNFVSLAHEDVKKMIEITDLNVN